MKIKSILFLLTIWLVSGLTAHAQSEVYRAEVFGGYMFSSISNGSSSSTTEYVIPGQFVTTSSSSSSRRQMHGFNTSLTGNSSKSVGWKFDFSHVSRSDSVSGSSKVKTSIQQYLGGVQFKNNIKDGAAFKPWAHVLAGIARQYQGTGGGTGTGSNYSQNDFAMVVGGGIDVKLGKRVDLRVIQFDYNPIFVKTRNGIEGHTQHNFRVGFGFVLH
jgi:hypothetical protein